MLHIPPTTFNFLLQPPLRHNNLFLILLSCDILDTPNKAHHKIIHPSQLLLVSQQLLLQLQYPVFCLLYIEYLSDFCLVLEILLCSIGCTRLFETMVVDCSLGTNHRFLFAGVHQLISQFAILIMDTMILLPEINLTKMSSSLPISRQLNNPFGFLTKYLPNLFLPYTILTPIFHPTPISDFIP